MSYLGAIGKGLVSGGTNVAQTNAHLAAANNSRKEAKFNSDKRIADMFSNSYNDTTNRMRAKHGDKMAKADFNKTVANEFVSNPTLRNSMDTVGTAMYANGEFKNDNPDVKGFAGFEYRDDGNGNQVATPMLWVDGGWFGDDTKVPATLGRSGDAKDVMYNMPVTTIMEAMKGYSAQFGNADHGAAAQVMANNVDYFEEGRKALTDSQSPEVREQIKRSLEENKKKNATKIIFANEQKAKGDLKKAQKGGPENDTPITNALAKSKEQIDAENVKSKERIASLEKRVSNRQGQHSEAMQQRLKVEQEKLNKGISIADGILHDEQSTSEQRLSAVNTKKTLAQESNRLTNIGETDPNAQVAETPDLNSLPAPSAGEEKDKPFKNDDWKGLHDLTGNVFRGGDKKEDSRSDAVKELASLKNTLLYSSGKVGEKRMAELREQHAVLQKKVEAERGGVAKAPAITESGLQHAVINNALTKDNVGEVVATSARLTQKLPPKQKEVLAKTSYKALTGKSAGKLKPSTVAATYMRYMDITGNPINQGVMANFLAGDNARGDAMAYMQMSAKQANAMRTSSATAQKTLAANRKRYEGQITTWSQAYDEKALAKMGFVNAQDFETNVLVSLGQNAALLQQAGIPLDMGEWTQNDFGRIHDGLERTLGSHGNKFGALDLLVFELGGKVLDQHGRLSKDIIPTLTSYGIKLDLIRKNNPSEYKAIVAKYGAGDPDQALQAMFFETRGIKK